MPTAIIITTTVLSWLTLLRSDVTPLRDYLVRHGATPARALSVAQTIVIQSRRQQVDPALITAMITVENPTLRSTSRSRLGATGLMQIMPLWRHTYAKECGMSLTVDSTNVCVGIRIYKLLRSQRKTVASALLAYNGCVSRWRRCGRYSTMVLGRQRIIRAQWSSWRWAVLLLP